MKLKIAIAFACFVVLNFNNTTAQTHNIVGANHEISSQILNETMQIQVLVPNGYEASEDAYPVLYLLDGQQYFNYGVSLSRNFQEFSLTPQFIIVGITTLSPQRYTYFDGEKDKFIDFMENELLPFVDKNYRTNTDRMIFGWQYAGSLALHIMIDHPSLFNGYFIASPFPIEQKVDDLDKISALNKALYFGVSPDEYEVNKGTDKLNALLSNKNIEGLRWSYLQFSMEEHRSTGFPTLYHSLREYFKYYPPLQVDNLKRFLDLGGLKYAEDFFEKRASLFGFDPAPTTWSKYTILRSAIKAEDYSNFKLFADALLNDDLIGELDGRAFDVASFYEKHQEHNKAIHIYNILLQKHPDSERLLTKMAESHTALGNSKEAKRYLKQAKATSGE
uniref:alpha/beta hydrolase-fold protein n=1 Tax=Fulvivirga sp. TaxID=1931237 RepID=UPI00404BA367